MPGRLAADPADPMLAGFCRASVGMALFMAGDTGAALRSVRRGHRRPVPAAERRADIDPGAVAPDPGRAGRPPGGGDHRRGPPPRGGRLPSERRPHRLRAGGARGPRGPSRPGRHHRRRARHFVRQLRDVGRPRPVHRRSACPGRRVGRAGALAESRPGSVQPAWDSTSWPGGAAACSTTSPPTRGQATGSPIGRRTCCGWSSTGWPTRRSPRPCGLSPRTVEKHVENLLRKIGARSRTELAVTSRRPTT